MSALRAAIACALIGATATATATATAPKKTAPVDLDALLNQFAKAPGLAAHFREEKHIALLDAPVINEGTIAFMPPARFARHTEKPIASTLLIDNGRLQFGDADGKQSMELGTNPVAKLFVDSFVMILAGDRKGLERVFTIKVAKPTAGGGGADAWRVALTPRVSPMDKVIRELTLSGVGLALRELEVRESSGDWSRTTFTDIDVNHRYTPAEQERVFRLPSR
ncbi:MAG: hypothetical protein QOI66_913 [Myxococcales bacterium]|jgi:hypothetical protein|nr:hypothetical protein [Myxococcales bacterium]